MFCKCSKIQKSAAFPEIFCTPLASWTALPSPLGALVVSPGGFQAQFGLPNEVQVWSNCLPTSSKSPPKLSRPRKAKRFPQTWKTMHCTPDYIKSAGRSVGRLVRRSGRRSNGRAIGRSGGQGVAWSIIFVPPCMVGAQILNVLIIFLIIIILL